VPARDEEAGDAASPGGRFAWSDALGEPSPLGGTSEIGHLLLGDEVSELGGHQFVPNSLDDREGLSVRETVIRRLTAAFITSQDTGDAPILPTTERISTAERLAVTRLGDGGQILRSDRVPAAH
jgi:hypothetical protein